MKTVFLLSWMSGVEGDTVLSFFSSSSSSSSPLSSGQRCEMPGAPSWVLYGSTWKSPRTKRQDEESPPTSPQEAVEGVDAKQENDGVDSDTDTDMGSCPICLCNFNDRAFTDMCFHTFCFECISIWAEQSRLCPLCKSPFSSIIHNVSGEDNYSRFILPPRPRPVAPSSSSSQHPPSRWGRAVARFAHHTWLGGPNWGRPSSPETVQIPFTAAHSRRRSVYMKHLIPRVSTLPRRRGPEISQSIWLDPKVMRRVTPFLCRELQALLRDRDVTLVQEFILGVLRNVPFGSGEMHAEIRRSLFEWTERFLSELATFVTSGLDVFGYDRTVLYDSEDRNWDRDWNRDRDQDRQRQRHRNHHRSRSRNHHRSRSRNHHRSRSRRQRRDHRRSQSRERSQSNDTHRRKRDLEKELAEVEQELLRQRSHLAQLYSQ